MIVSVPDSRERRRAHRLAWRVIAFFKENPEWEIRYMRLREERVWRRLGFGKPIVGVTMWDRSLIGIDPSYEDLLAVLIHECLHAVLSDPDSDADAEEEKVLALEALIRKHLTLRQARAFTLLLADRLK